MLKKVLVFFYASCILIVVGCSSQKRRNVDFPLPQGFVEFITIYSSEYSLNYNPNVEYNPENTYGDEYFIKKCTAITKKSNDEKEETVTILNEQGDTLLIYTSLTNGYEYTYITTYAKLYEGYSALKSNPKILEFAGNAAINVVEMDVLEGTRKIYKLTSEGESYLLCEQYSMQIPNYDPMLTRGAVSVNAYFREYYPNGNVRKYIDNEGRVTRFTEDGDIIQGRKRGGNMYGSTSFRHESDVHDYLRSHNFINQSGDISITEGSSMALTANGRILTAAINIREFNSHQAYFTAYSPISGVTFRFTLDSSDGTLYCQNEGVTYYAR